MKQISPSLTLTSAIGYLDNLRLWWLSLDILYICMDGTVGHFTPTCHVYGVERVSVWVPIDYMVLVKQGRLLGSLFVIFKRLHSALLILKMNNQIYSGHKVDFQHIQLSGSWLVLSCQGKGRKQNMCFNKCHSTRPTGWSKERDNCNMSLTYWKTPKQDKLKIKFKSSYWEIW